MKRITALIALLAAAGVLTGVAAAAAPANTAKPGITGTEKAGSTLTAGNGTWGNSPTSYAYQWRRCATDGSSCGDIVGATSKTYSVTTTDVHHAIRVVVTAKNGDGSTAATSDPTGVIGSANGPTNTVKPDVSGNALPGETLTVSQGTWSTTPTSFGYQWQHCESDGTGCLNVAGANGSTYGVRTTDAGGRLRALVTARTAKGQTTVASGTSDLVDTGTTTTTTTVAGNHAPTITFLSLRRLGARVYARFRICDDSVGKVTVLERDHKAGKLSYGRKFTMYHAYTCFKASRHWTPAARFRGRGKYTVTLRAVDLSGAKSRIVSRSLIKR